MKILISVGAGISLLLTASLGAAETEVHRWVDADGVTHYADAPPADATPFETTTVVTEAGEASAEATERPRWRPLQQQPRRGTDERAAAAARCRAMLEELRAITDQRRRGHSAAGSAALRARSVEITRARQRECRAGGGGVSPGIR